MQSLWRILSAVILVSLAAVGRAQTHDSTNVGAAGTLTPSNCQNLAGTWYPVGQVPAGYYKQAASPYDCKPIPSCPGNQSFGTSSEACQCAAGTSWDSVYNTCHTPCAGGTAWNGSSCASICGAGTAWNGSTCASICIGGQAWNGSACACPAGQTWNGTTCGAPPNITSFSVTPASQTVGSNFTVSWGATGATSLTLNCTGANANSSALSPVSGGTKTFAASKSGSTTCSVSASSSYGSDSASAAAVSAVCASGTSWNGSSCVSVCSGGQSWNGSACVCSSGQLWNGSACGAVPVFSSFSLTPATQAVGSNFTVGWGVTGSSTTVTMSCTGANPASYTLSPSAGGTGSLAAAKAGVTNCTATASNPWGSDTASDSGTAACPTGKQWDAPSSSCVPAAPQTCTGNDWLDTSTNTCKPPRYINVNGRFNMSSNVQVMKVTAITTSKVIIETTTAGSSSVVASCTLSAPGQVCHLRGSGNSASNFMVDYCATSNMMGECQQGNRYANAIVDNLLRLEANSGRFGSVASAKLESDGSVSLWFAYAGGGFDFYQSSANAHRTWNSGTISAAAWQSWAPGSTHSANLALNGSE